MLHLSSAQVLFLQSLVLAWALLVSFFPFVCLLAPCHNPNRTLNTDIDDFAKALDSVFQGKATILNRMRLACTFYSKDLAQKATDGDCPSLLLTVLFQTSLSQLGRS